MKTPDESCNQFNQTNAALQCGCKLVKLALISESFLTKAFLKLILKQKDYFYLVNKTANKKQPSQLQIKQANLGLFDLAVFSETNPQIYLRFDFHLPFDLPH